MENAHNVLTTRTADGNVLQLEYYKTLLSAAELAREYARTGSPDRYCVLAERQSDLSLCGEGTRKSGDTAYGVFLSVILRPRFFPTQAGFLGELAAVALASALEEHTVFPMDIGWVSDIFCDGRRVAGVAMEAMFDRFSAYEYLIVNFAVRLDPAVFPPRLSDMVKQIFTTDEATLPYLVAKSILDRFFRLYPSVREPEKFMDEYRHRFVMGGLPAVYLDGAKSRPAKILGVDQKSGELLLELKSGATVSVSGKSKLLLPKRPRRRRKTKKS